MAHRPASQQSIHCLSRRSPLHLRTAIVRTRPSQIQQARQLWWWGRKSSAGYPEQDAEEERFLRQQRHVRNRYVKIVRRRAMWDRESTSESWPWQRRRFGRHCQDTQHLSSREAMSKRDEQKSDDPGEDDNSRTFHKDFDSFRQAVDRAMERDPYGTLFGRRLWSPPSLNNSSWTSFSWIFDPKEIREVKPDSDKAASKPPSSDAPSHMKPAPAATSEEATEKPVEYEYDPISMRKVPKAFVPSVETSQPTLSSQRTPDTNPEGLPKRGTNRTPNKIQNDTTEEPAADPRRKTIFETLFAENAVDIPVKTYNPKVYGYIGKDPQEKTTENKPRPSRSPFENSRKREFQALKAATLGNAIDTTAEFGGKYAEPGSGSDVQTSPRSTEQTTPRNEEATSFRNSDDAREAQVGDSQHEKLPKKSNWLAQFEREGALKEPGERPLKGFHPAVKAKEVEGGRGSPVTKHADIETSLNRLNSLLEAKADRLQPSLDRSDKIASATSRKSPSESSWESKISAAEKAEDIDLLRPRDVRAAMKADRTTKQEIESQKQQTRERLEKAFAARPTEAEEVQKPQPRSKASLEHVWKHVESNPQGIVARTIKSMGSFNENFKKYMRPANDLNEPLTQSDESPSKTPTIFKASKPLCVPSDTPKEVLDAEKSMTERRTALQRSNSEAIATDTAENEKLDRLAKEIKDIYEDRYGKIDDDHQAAKPAESRKPHPLSTASVKEGISPDPVIDNHVSKFEPEYSRLVYEMKDVRRQLHEAKLHVRQLRFSIRRKPWAESEAARLAEYAKEAVVEEDASAYGLDEPVYAESKKASDHSAQSLDQPIFVSEPTKRDTDPKGLDEPIAAHPEAMEPRSKMADDLRAQSDPPTMQEPVFTPSGSPEWNDEQPPPIAELKAATTEFTSPVVILVLEPVSKTVKAIPSPSVPHVTPRETLNPFSLLAGFDETQVANVLKYFPRLQNAGYELIDGDKNKLVFRKPVQVPPATSIPSKVEPSFESPTKEAATVLNEMPTEIDPPGPSAPIAPPTSIPTSPVRPTTGQPRVKRQEKVLTGGATTASPSATSTPPSSAHSSPTPPPPPPPHSDPTYDYATQTPKPSDGIFNRLARSVRRVTLTILALAGGAYMIGFIAEGIGAQAQAQRGISRGGEAVGGPRKKIVLPVDVEDGGQGQAWKRGTRPGIYSTESSRRD